MSSTNSQRTPDDISHVPTIELIDRGMRALEVETASQEQEPTIIDRAKQIGATGVVTLTLITAAPRFTSSAQAAESNSAHVVRIAPHIPPLTEGSNAQKPIDEVYDVRTGDNLSEISARFGLSLKGLEEINTEIANPNLIFPKEEILLSNRVCADKQVEAVPGATVSSYERLYGISRSQFMQENPSVKSANLIYAGDCYSVLPDAGPSSTPKPEKPEPVIAPHPTEPNPENASRPAIPESREAGGTKIPPQPIRAPLHIVTATPGTETHVSLPETSVRPAPIVAPHSPVQSIDNLSPTVLAEVEAAAAAYHHTNGSATVAENPGFELPIPSPEAAEQAAAAGGHLPTTIPKPVETSTPIPEHHIVASAEAIPETHHLTSGVEGHVPPTIPEIIPQSAVLVEHQAITPVEPIHPTSSINVPAPAKLVTPQAHLQVPIPHPLEVVTGHHHGLAHSVGVQPTSTVINLPPGIHPDSAQIAAAIAAKYGTPIPTTEAWINAHDPNITGNKIVVPVNPIAGGKLLGTVEQEALTPITPGTYGVNTNYFSYSGFSANQFNQALAGTGLAGLGQEIAYEERVTGINGIIVESHARIESADGDSEFARTRNNLFGIGAFDSDPNNAFYYPTKAASIAAYVQLLLKNYLTAQGQYYGGSTTISSVFVHYSTAGQAEAASVANLANIESEKIEAFSQPAPVSPLVTPPTAVPATVETAQQSPTPPASSTAEVATPAQNIVKAALAIEWPNQGHGLIPSPAYTNALNQTFGPEAAQLNETDCHVNVAEIMHLSGVDPNFPDENTWAQQIYVTDHPNKYDVFTPTNLNQLEPGDLMYVNGAGKDGQEQGHTYVYTGVQPNGFDGESASLGEHTPQPMTAYLRQDGVPFIDARFKA